MTKNFALARPKVNLMLHVLGKRQNGYHKLESLAVFAESGDRVTAKPSQGLSLSVDGPFAKSLDTGGDNLVLRAAKDLRDWATDAGQGAPGAALHLDKRLPVASGIGGGSADAAATLSVLRQLWALDISDKALAGIAIGLGADVPVCLDSRSRVIRGIGEELTDAPALPEAWLVLANPMRPVSTAAVFSMLDQSAPRDALDWPDAFETVAALAAWLAGETRNDLEAPARQLAPEIDMVLSALAGCDGAHIARMSGSGATCFALFDDRAKALSAQDTLRIEHPGWWVEAAAMSR